MFAVSESEGKKTKQIETPIFRTCFSIEMKQEKIK